MNKQITLLLEKLKEYEEALGKLKLDPNVSNSSKVLDKADDVVHMIATLSSRLYQIRGDNNAGC